MSDQSINESLGDIFKLLSEICYQSNDINKLAKRNYIEREKFWHNIFNILNTYTDIKAFEIRIHTDNSEKMCAKKGRVTCMKINVINQTYQIETEKNFTEKITSEITAMTNLLLGNTIKCDNDGNLYYNNNSIYKILLHQLIKQHLNLISGINNIITELDDKSSVIIEYVIEDSKSYALKHT